MFPARDSDLPNGTHWNMSGDHGGSQSRDLNIARKSGGSWTHLHPGGGGQNEDEMVFGMPLYAPADGVVLSCWRQHPDNPEPGTPHIERCCGNDCETSCDDDACPASQTCKIMRSGNHVALRKDDGAVVLIAHLQRGTLPASICPKPDTFMTDARVRSGIFPKESFLRICDTGESPAADDCVTERPTIKQGTFIGRAGNSGASSGSHLHFHTQAVRVDNGVFKKDGANLPALFNYGWLKHRTDASLWKPFRNDTIRNNPVLVHASPFLRRATATAGGVSRTATQFISGNRMVTASISSSDNKLKLITWDLVGVSRFRRRDDIDAGAVKEVYLSEPLDNHILAAVRQQDDTLKMIAYQVGVDGRLFRRDSFAAGKVSRLAMATLHGVNRRSVTAMRDANGNLRLIAWDIVLDNTGTASIVRLGQATAGAVSAVSVSRAKHFNGVYTGVRDGSGNLKVIPWVLSSNGQSFVQRNAGSAGATSTVLDVAPLAGGVAAAIKDSNGKLRMITWTVAADGDVTQRRGLNVAGDVTEVDLLTVPYGESNLAAVVRGADNRMYLLGWKVNADGRHLRRLGSSRAGEASRISADSIARSHSASNGGDRDMIVTTLRNADGKLNLISWDTNLINP